MSFKIILILIIVPGLRKCFIGESVCHARGSEFESQNTCEKLAHFLRICKPNKPMERSEEDTRKSPKAHVFAS